jgi:hypothetical protein
VVLSPGQFSGLLSLVLDLANASWASTVTGRANERARCPNAGIAQGPRRSSLQRPLLSELR